MKALIARSLTGAMFLLGGTALTVAIPAHRSTDGGAMLVADTNDFAAKRGEYLQKAQDALQSWQTRMGNWTDDAKAHCREISEETRREANFRLTIDPRDAS